MKTTSLKMLIAVALSISAVSAVNAAPVSSKTLSTIAYDQRDNAPFPTSDPEVRDNGIQVLVDHQGGTDPFPPSGDAAPETSQVIAHHEGGTDPFPPSSDAAPETSQVIAHHQGGTDPFPPSSDAAPETSQVIAHHEGGTDPFPPAAEASVTA